MAWELAYFVFGEIPATFTFVGGAMVLGGLYMLAREERPDKMVLG